MTAKEKLFVRMRDLPGWMPRPIESVTISADASAVENGTIDHVLRVQDDHIVFACKFKKHAVYFGLNVPDPETGKRVAKLLRRNQGKTLSSIGNVEIPAAQEPA